MLELRLNNVDQTIHAIPKIQIESVVNKIKTRTFDIGKTA